MEQVTAFRHVRPYNISNGQRYLVNHPNMTRAMCYDNCKSYRFPYAGLNDGYYFLLIFRKNNANIIIIIISDLGVDVVSS